MQLTQEQKDKVRAWAAEGAGLAEIQSRIAEEFGITLSYMDTRFLVLDLDAAIKDKEQPKEPNKADADMETAPGDESAASGGVSVTISAIARPGFMITGDVTFSDGVKATWGMLNDGRFSLDAGDPAYRPSQEDLQEFQLQLRDLISGQGY